MAATYDVQVDRLPMLMKNPLSPLGEQYSDAHQITTGIQLDPAVVRLILSHLFRAHKCMLVLQKQQYHCHQKLVSCNDMSLVFYNFDAGIVQF